MDDKKSTYYETLVKKEWSYTSGAVVMSVLAVMLASFAGNWGVAGPLAIWGGKFLTFIGIDADSWKMFGGSLAKYRFLNNQAAITNVALIFGAMISCLLAAQWKIRGIRSPRQVWAAAIGGILMGIGARINPGCNIGAMFSSIPALSLSGWIFLVFMFLGAAAGGKILTKWFLPPVSYERKERRKKPSPEQRKRNRIIQIIIGAALIIAWLVFALATKEAAPSAGFMLFIGIGIGYALQRSRFCFTAAYRDPVLTGSVKMTKALLIALAVSTIGFAGIHMSRYGVDLSKLPEIAPGGAIGLHLVIGSFIFGIGAVLAGCCACGIFIRIGEGCIQSLIALLFFITGYLLGAPLMSNIVQKSVFLYSGKGIYLPKLLGGFGPAILIQLLVLLLLWIAADRWERRKFSLFLK
ncbi:MAG: YeeE/YedE family protein [Spirochaetaceae bacterium]|jgi:uncharacterized membrane protein YedE/YeeE|nr:YeeE/YedE family protein [Spirochaetaceae bacterium]